MTTSAKVAEQADNGASESVENRKQIAEVNVRLRETLTQVEDNNQLLAEALSNAVAMLRQEDIGWAQPSLGTAYRGLELADMQNWSQQIRASLTGTDKRAPNPHMRNGIMLRHSFIWDGGIHYDWPKASGQGRTNVQDRMDLPDNKRLVFSASARRKREHALYADGFYMLVGDNKKKTLRPVPLSQITDVQCDDIFEDDIIAYRWTRHEAVRDKGTKRLTGQREEVSYWVYVDWYTGNKATSIRYNGKVEKVLTGFTAFDMHANRPDGQIFGSPDAISALVWARVIRDLIMNGVKMQDALAMFAFKATAKRKEGKNNTDMELAEPHEAGSTASLAGDNDLVPMSTAGRGYDFGSIGFVVATMAASLHLSGISLSANTALAGSSYGAAKTLDLPGRMAMETRRAEHIEFDERLLMWLGASKGTTAFFQNYDDATDEYRSVQAAMLMWQSGNLSPEGFRAELENVYGRKLMGEIPQGIITPNNQEQEDRKAAAAEKAAKKVTPAPDQGKSNKAGNADHASDMPT